MRDLDKIKSDWDVQRPTGRFAPTMDTVKVHDAEQAAIFMPESYGAQLIQAHEALALGCELVRCALVLLTAHNEGVI